MYFSGLQNFNSLPPLAPPPETLISIPHARVSQQQLPPRVPCSESPEEAARKAGWSGGSGGEVFAFLASPSALPSLSLFSVMKTFSWIFCLPQEASLILTLFKPSPSLLKKCIFLTKTGRKILPLISDSREKILLPPSVIFFFLLQYWGSNPGP